MGISLTHNTINIYPRNDYYEMDRQSVYARFQNGTYTLFWKQPYNYENLKNYTIFWCLAKPADNTQCMSAIDYEYVPKNQVNYIKVLENYSDVLNFAISANYENFSTGMNWAVCSSDIESEINKLSEIDIAEIKRDSIRIQWYPRTIVCPSILKGYKLGYCAHNALHQNCKTITLNNSESKSYTFTNLKPFTNYSISFSMLSYTREGPQTVVYVTTKEAGPSPPLDLQVHNITSNSIRISWKAPKVMNGILHHYTFHWYAFENSKNIYNTVINFFFRNKITKDNQIDISSKEFKDIKASNLTEINGRIYYDSSQLSSYTEYVGYITAYTVADSDPSNLINFMTLIGSK